MPRKPSAIRVAIESTVSGVVSVIPRRLRRILLSHLIHKSIRCGDDAYAALVELAAQYNIKDFVVEGDAGMIRGSAGDMAVLKHYATHGTWAVRVVDLCQTFFRQRGPGLFIDVGANIGLTTIPIAGSGAMICIAIEPEPSNFAYLSENTATAGLSSSVHLHNVAVFSSTNDLLLELADSNKGDHRLRPADSRALSLENEHQRQVVRVPARTLDDLCGDLPAQQRLLGRPVGIKIDVQGAEPFVCEGGSVTISHADFLISEFSPYLMARMNASPEAILSTLQSHFRFLTIGHGESGPLLPTLNLLNGIETLRRFARMESANPATYLDVIAHNEPLPVGSGLSVT